jgi:hypothetical protein
LHCSIAKLSSLQNGEGFGGFSLIKREDIPYVARYEAKGPVFAF